MKIELLKLSDDYVDKSHSTDLIPGCVYLDRDGNVCLKVSKGSVILESPDHIVEFNFFTHVRGIKEIFGMMTITEEKNKEENKEIIFAQKRLLEL